MIVDGRVAVRNVRSYRRDKDVVMKVPGIGPVTEDIAWGGNWFFLTEFCNGLSVALENIAGLTTLSRAIRSALREPPPEELDRVSAEHAEWVDDEFVAANLARWLRE